MPDTASAQSLSWAQLKQGWPARLIVMRHATHSNGLVGGEGCEQIRDVARSLAEWCLLTRTEITHVEPYTTHDKLGHEVVATARLMQQNLSIANDELRRVNTTRRINQIHPALTPVYAPTEGVTTARIVVLNEPQAGEFINALSGLTIELQRGEIILLERARHLARIGGRWFFARVPYRARWTMAPRESDGDKALQQVVEKIASKMKTAGVLGGLITTLLTFVLTRLFGDGIPWGIPAFTALMAFGVSTALFFVSMFFYDSLTMPPRFWGLRARRSRWNRAEQNDTARRIESPAWLLARPPSPTIRVLQLNMVRVWSWVFVPAVLMLGLGLAALLVALDAPSVPAQVSTAVTQSPLDGGGNNQPGATDNGSVNLGAAHAAVLTLAGIATVGWSVAFRPRLGASD